ncbi:MAG: MerR family transcriptional regulator [Lachnospiraceae bacterium]|nr:MerR family transcriptional regulator [Lachnospiraceae bacterium]
MSELKTLQEICNELGVTRRAVQGYEKANLVSRVGKNKYGYLLFGEAERDRIRRIKLYQQFGFKIKEIKNLIDAPDCIVKETLERQVLILKKEQEELNTLIEIAKELIAELGK